MSDAIDASEAARVAEEIRRRIFDGRFGPGERLVQQAIAADLGVSRLPVRTAFGILAHEGLVETRERRGTVVRAFGPRDLANLVEVHKAIDLLALRLAAERADDTDVERMVDAEARMKAAVDREDMDAARATIFEFRALLIGAARNPVLTQASAVIDQRMRHLFAIVKDPRMLQLTASRVIEGLRSGDGESAEEGLRARLTESRHRHRDELISTLLSRETSVEFDDESDDVPMGAASAAFNREELRLGVETERVLAELRAAILEHRREAGSRLSERAIAEELGAGRIPTRRAIETLVSEGLAEAGGPRSAARVRALTSEDVIDMLQVCERLSALTLRAAGERINRAGLRDLRGLLREMDEAGDDKPRVQNAMEAFRLRLLEVADNDALLAADLIVRWRLRRYLSDVVALDLGRQFCRSLYNALAFRDPDLAEQSVRTVFGIAIDGHRARAGV